MIEISGDILRGLYGSDKFNVGDLIKIRGFVPRKGMRYEILKVKQILDSESLLVKRGHDGTLPIEDGECQVVAYKKT